MIVCVCVCKWKQCKQKEATKLIGKHKRENIKNSCSRALKFCVFHACSPSKSTSVPSSRCTQAIKKEEKIIYNANLHLHVKRFFSLSLLILLNQICKDFVKICSRSYHHRHWISYRCANILIMESARRKKNYKKKLRGKFEKRTRQILQKSFVSTNKMLWFMNRFA